MFKTLRDTINKSWHALWLGAVVEVGIVLIFVKKYGGVPTFLLKKCYSISERYCH